MKEYIKRDDAIKIIGTAGFWEEEDREVAITCLEQTHAADVVEVKHGRWLLEREPDGTPYCFHCSVCDDDYHYIGIKSATDYCPNCGARMDKES